MTIEPSRCAPLSDAATRVARALQIHEARCLCRVNAAHGDASVIVRALAEWSRASLVEVALGQGFAAHREAFRRIKSVLGRAVLALRTQEATSRTTGSDSARTLVRLCQRHLDTQFVQRASELGGNAEGLLRATADWASASARQLEGAEGPEFDAYREVLGVLALALWPETEEAL